MMIGNYSIDPEAIIDIARCAGKEIINIYRHDNYIQKKKADNSLLTEADLRAHKVIVERLLVATPDIPILSEESSEISYEERRHWDFYWLVDPLDGTKEFVNKNGEFTVNIALIGGENPVFGVVHAPVLDETWIGESGKHAKKITSRKVEVVNVKKHKTSEPWRVVGSRSHAGDSLKLFLEGLGSYELLSIGSSIKLCLVAEGKAHIYPRLGPTSEWDTAAAHAVVNSAGGEVVSIENEQPLIYNKKNLRNPYFIVRSSKEKLLYK